MNAALQNPLPHNLEAEEQILGALLLDGAAIDRTEGLSASDFYKKTHGLIFGAAALLKECGDPIDSISLTSELERRGQFEEIGGNACLLKLVRTTPTDANISYHSRIVKDLAIKRKVLKSFYSLYSEIPQLTLPEISERIANIVKTLDLPTERHREINLTHEIEKWLSVTNGYFSVTDCFSELQTITGVTNRNNYRVILHRLATREKNRLLQKDPKKAGVYRKIENICEDMDILNAATTPHPLKLPLDLRKFVKVMPKNILMAAGAKSSGKTAFLLNTAYENRDLKEGVFYYNSEMASEELRIRLDEFGSSYPISEWQKIRFKERTSNFDDVIRQAPDAVHIIDFLEIYDDFYAIGGMIRDIHDALGKGIAIIAIQKNEGTTYGLGGARSIEKARLYLTLDRGVIKITDAKLFTRKDVNPRGLQIEYKLVGGCKYIPDVRGWHNPEEKL